MLAAKAPDDPEFYFFEEHRERDLDCFDLDNITKESLKRAMRFSDDDLKYAGQLKFLYTR